MKPVKDRKYSIDDLDRLINSIKSTLNMKEEDIAIKAGYNEGYISQTRARGFVPDKFMEALKRQFANSNVTDGQILNDAGNGEENYIQKRRALKGISEPVTVPLVPAKAQAGYVRSFDQVTFLEALEKYALPPGVDHRGATWRYFEVEGESMSPTFESGDIVLASMVPQMDWQEIRNFYIYIILTDTELYIKRVYRKSSKNWVMISDNEKQYQQVLIPVENIKEVWVFRRHIDSKAPPPKKFEIKV